MNQKIKNIPGYEGGAEVFSCTRAKPYDPNGDYEVPIFHPEAYDDDGTVFCPVCLTRFDEAVVN